MHLQQANTWPKVGQATHLPARVGLVHGVIPALPCRVGQAGGGVVRVAAGILSGVRNLS